MNEITVIQGVRGYCDENGTAWLSAEDVARGLGFTQTQEKVSTSGRKIYESILGNPSDVKKRLDDDLVIIEGISDGLGRLQNMTFITEAGLYDVLIDSCKPKAKEFRKWLTGEVAVSIRKTGTYSITKNAQSNLLKAA